MAAQHTTINDTGVDTDSLYYGIWLLVGTVVFIAFIIHWIQIIQLVCLRRRLKMTPQHVQPQLTSDNDQILGRCTIPSYYPNRHCWKPADSHSITTTDFGIKQMEKQDTALFDSGARSNYGEVVRLTWEQQGDN